MINVLINAYAVSPTWGSEPGMGWNWIINIARYCKVHVITEGEWKDDIEDALATLPQKDNIQFYYLPVSDKIRRMCWNQGDWRFYWYYRKWQKRAYEKALEIINTNKIDIVHQLNMVGFREPGYLWKIENKPFVWGPIGGMGDIPLAYVSDSGWKQKSFCRIKNFLNNLQIRFSSRVRSAISRDFTIAATKEVQEKVKNVFGKDIPMINETGCQEPTSHTITPVPPTELFNILWVGRFLYSKKLDLALRIIAELNDKSVRLIICGEGTPEQNSYYRDLADKLGITENVIWLGKVDHNEVSALMQNSNLFLFTSVMEATSTVVLEAIENGLPIVSFNTCGFGPIVKAFAGTTVELSNPEQSIKDFASVIKSYIADKSKLTDVQKAQEKNRHRLSWDSKARELNKIYSDLTKSYLEASK